MTYWLSSLAMVAFGFIASFSIGQPFFLVGLVMLSVGAFRDRPLIFWPPVAAVVAYNVTYLAIAPLACTSTAGTRASSSTACSSLLGIRYDGAGAYNPPLTPAILTGLAAAAVVLLLTVVVLRLRR